MSREDEIRSLRLDKIKRLREKKIAPYSERIGKYNKINKVLSNFEQLEKSESEGSILGRMLVRRSAGKIVFAKIFDGTGRMQVVLKQDLLGKEKMKLFEKLFDVGDFIQFFGTFFRTKTGEKSLLVKDFHLLSKSLLPLPEKWAGLQDKEEIYRKRYLQLIQNPEVFERFILRSKIIKEIRHFLDERDFLEIETPILQTKAGGAMARTFRTHHNDLDIDMVLRISLEIDHKIIMAAGYPRIYEIGKAFRNEGSDPTHIQEFTMIEWYAAYEDLEQNMKWTEELLRGIAEKIFDKTEFRVWDHEGKEKVVSLEGVWPRYDFSELVKKNTGIDIFNTNREELEKKAAFYGAEKSEIKKMSDANLIDFIYKKSSRNKIINPAFVLNYPGSLKPLAQQSSDGTAKVAQLIIAGAEITNQYAELIDPVKQRELLLAQLEERSKGDEEAMDIDERFLSAMEYGMPPMTGFGMGIDRLVAFFTEQKNLRDTIFFPIMRPKDEN